MEKSMQNILFSYFKGGMEKGQVIENVTLEEQEGELAFAGTYSQLRSQGYLREDIGTAKGTIKHIETEAAHIVNVQATYSGKINGQSYDYTLNKVYEMIFENGLVYVVTKDSRTNEKSETYYKMQVGRGLRDENGNEFDYSLRDYVGACSNPISIYDGKFEKSKIIKK